MESFNGTYRLFDIPVVKVEQELSARITSAGQKSSDEYEYCTGVSVGTQSNNDLVELTIWFDCWRESLPSLPELSHLKNDIIHNRILLL